MILCPRIYLKQKPYHVNFPYYGQAFRMMPLPRKMKAGLLQPVPRSNEPQMTVGSLKAATG